MTANDPSLQQEAANMVMLNSMEKAIVRIRNQSTVDSDVFDQRERALLSKFEERPKSGLMIPSCCECPHNSSVQERFFRPSISTHPVIDQIAQAVVSSSRNYLCGLRHRYWQRAGLELAQPLVPVSSRLVDAATFFRKDATFGVGLSTGAWRLEEGPEIKQLGQSSSIFVRLSAWRASASVSADDHYICDSSRNCDPTSPGSGLENVKRAQEP